MKKLSFLLALVLIASMLAMPVFAAQNVTMTISASQTTVNAGDTITITVTSSAISNCFSGGYLFSYNEQIFEYVADSGTANVTDVALSGVSTINGHLAGYFSGMRNGFEIYPGTLFEITLKVKDTIPSGDYTITGEPVIMLKNGDTYEEATCTTNSVVITTIGNAPCEHEWQAATCETPKTCSICLETEGEALGHNMQETEAAVEATCTAVGKTAVLTCANGCGLTEGGTEVAMKAHNMQNGVCVDCGHEGGLLGDANGDNKVNLRDAILVLQAANGKPVAIDRSAADVTGDGKVNLQDAIRILKRANGNKDPFPAEK